MCKVLKQHLVPKCYKVITIIMIDPIMNSKLLVWKPHNMVKTWLAQKIIMLIKFKTIIQTITYS